MSYKQFFILAFLSVHFANANNVSEVDDFIIKKGWFLASQVGLFSSLGGFSDTQTQIISNEFIIREKRALSRLAPQVGLLLGYDLGGIFSLGLKLEQGYVAGAARIADIAESPTHYALTLVNFILLGNWNFYKRFSLMGTFGIGGVFMTPRMSDKISNIGANICGSFGLRYDTLLSGLFVGVELSSNWSLISDTGIDKIPGIISFSLIPKIGYVF
ncbi:MAG: hypothetical protein O2897_03160 [bacterium]|nr:hypothetical protein [bacterium]